MSEHAATDQTLRIHRAFIDGIRTVAIIDDQMKPYHEVVGVKLPPASNGEVESASVGPYHAAMNPEDEFAVGESDRTPTPVGEADSVSVQRAGAGKTENMAAAALTTDFSGRGWFHDLRCDRFETAHELAANSDLIVLDYILGQDPDAAIRILSRLAESDRMHLVVLYTREEESKVWFNIVTLFGAEPAQPSMDGEEQTRFESWVEEERQTPEQNDIALCLAGKLRVPLPPELSRGRKSMAEPPIERWRVIRSYQEARRLCAGANQDRVRLAIQPVEQMDISGGDCKWVRCGNVFVVVQRKGQPPLAGNKIIERLVSALGEWDPSFLRLMLREARHRFAAQGVGADGKLLRGKHGEAAWLIFANTGSPEERILHRRTLYNRLFEGFAQTLLEAWPSETTTSDAYEYAAGKTGLDEEGDREETYFHLNHVLAFEEGIPPHLRTGTLFAIPGNDQAVGVCVSPECDLVPRTEKAPSQIAEASAAEHPSGEGETVHAGAPPALPVRDVRDASDERSQPAFVVLWRALNRMSWSPQNKGKCVKALGKAEGLGHLFLRAEPNAEKYVIDLSEARKPHAFFVSNGGRIENGSFFATRVVVGANGVPRIEDDAPKAYRVIAQLRELYATKLLHETAHQLSRVGVDFVSLPEKEKKKKK